ncbi:MAG: AraC family transcriptional regulator [Clostridia bacterium]|nr:AraC family transcriptional regulator [Clostridia bacterium]
MKIRRAIIMMNAEKSVKEIASELGFYDQNYFSTVFKRITGKSPIKYKKDVMRGEYS